MAAFGGLVLPSLVVSAPPTDLVAPFEPAAVVVIARQVRDDGACPYGRGSAQPPSDELRAQT